MQGHSTRREQAGPSPHPLLINLVLVTTFLPHLHPTTPISAPYNMKLFYSTLLVSALTSVLVTAAPIRDTKALELNARYAIDEVAFDNDFAYRGLDDEDDFGIQERDAGKAIKHGLQNTGQAIKHGSEKAGHAAKKCMMKLGKMLCARDAETDEFELALRDEDTLVMRDLITGEERDLDGRSFKSFIKKVEHGLGKVAKVVLRDEEPVEYELVLRDGVSFELEDSDELDMRDLGMDEEIDLDKRGDGEGKHHSIKHDDSVSGGGRRRDLGMDEEFDLGKRGNSGGKRGGAIKVISSAVKHADSVAGIATGGRRRDLGMDEEFDLVKRGGGGGSGKHGAAIKIANSAAGHAAAVAAHAHGSRRRDLGMDEEFDLGKRGSGGGGKHSAAIKVIHGAAGHINTVKGIASGGS
ncbi:hypothetical protein CALVIDRAFT_537420 [Calocera viscosa TUFC12733]|uniref:Uncharacterized protein n=1 Tax=Calocera viscosa (strain TUFC12733) TaxID=1330018 RepID=A0A167M127_CALVF|nr:hypothetical protein CALVIDRAFT_537420 [Calocera viscosa TUFC12733]